VIACIGIENKRVVARLYGGNMHIDYGPVESVTKEYVEGQLRLMGHSVVEPWEMDSLGSSEEETAND
jgi:hypothetical protein